MRVLGQKKASQLRVKLVLFYFFYDYSVSNFECKMPQPQKPIILSWETLRFLMNFLTI